MAEREQDIRRELALWKEAKERDDKKKFTREGVDILKTTEYGYGVRQIAKLEAKIKKIDEGRRKTQEQISKAYRNNTSRNNIKK